jgi:hypothetical protein
MIAGTQQKHCMACADMILHLHAGFLLAIIVSMSWAAPGAAVAHWQVSLSTGRRSLAGVSCKRGTKQRRLEAASRAAGRSEEHQVPRSPKQSGSRTDCQPRCS